MGEATEVPGIDSDSVTAWFAENIEGAKPPLTFVVIVGGHSNLTYRVTDAAGTDFVLRRPPLGAVLATAHDMAREHRIITGVGKTDVPVPDAVGLCEDESVNGAPFYVMNFVAGDVLAEQAEVEAALPDLGARQRLGTDVADVLAKLHLANPDDVGLGDLGRKEAYLDRQLKRWRTQWENSKTRDLPAMEETYELLLQAKPEQRYTGIVHGDYRLGNMLATKQGTVAAVLDWELCTLGDTLADIGYVLNNWIQPGEDLTAHTFPPPTYAAGFSTRDQFVARYAEQTGHEVANVDYYRAFQHWRLAAIVEGVMARYIKGVMVDDSVDTADYDRRVHALANDARTLVRGSA